MIKLDEDALICDFAETYGVLDYRAIPLSLAATLATGLRADSRIKIKASEIPYSLETILQATIADTLRLILWSKTKDAETGINQPKLLASLLINGEETTGYDSPQDFIKEREKIVSKIKRGS